ncbi:hypothetical protein EZJ49_08025 [Bdellovibrio bacteriovorus]|uniref:hypothetical protein n=1 Tax=Bdellovibrio bacteriovorus TaxID=959 RepID=UPI0021CF1F82|nr:hypothetical protein [Bdellovibrio bacteriovorus]UXR66196.1 hypothetical protein EZJ49_08025 [Bdellovibrio bacteriovorus]
MTVEKFLSFWDQHNTAIIEGLVALIILISLLLAYRAFFAKKDKGGADVGNGSLDAAQLEKTLQKILDNQQASGKSSRSAAASEDFGVDVEMDDSPAPVRGQATPAAAATASAAEVSAAIEGAKESAAEVAQLRLSLSEGHQKIAELQAQLQAAQATEQASPTDGAAAEGGMSSAEKEELNGKLRDLEARLAEYEIISEDIADLSRYRDENEDLKKQLDALKAGGAVASAPEAAASEPAPAPAEAPAAEPAPDVAPPAEATPAEGGSDLIDDDLMKEFAAAVEGQRALDKAAEKAGDGSDESAKAGDETNQLMSEFENFVSKKS